MVGTRPKAIVAGTMAATALVSMWVSNTATAAMMVPIVLSVIDVALRRRTGKGLAEHGGIPARTATCPTSRYRRCSASRMPRRSAARHDHRLAAQRILVRFVEQTSGIRIGFVEWMAIGVPAMLAFLPLACS